MSVLNNISISLVGKVLSVAIQLITTMVIARLLTPNELGVFAIAAASSTVLAALKNFGTSNYLIQCKTIDYKAVGSAFTATFAISGVLGASLYFAAPPIAEFFDEPAIVLVLRILSLNFALTPLLTIGVALLVRSHRFKTLVTIEVSSALAGAIVSVLGALNGFASTALALGVTVHTLTTLVLVVKAKPEWLTFIPSLRDLRLVIGFGGWASGAVLFNQFGSRGTDFIVGKVLGVSSTAIFDKGASLARLLSDQLLEEVLRVVWPVFADDARKSDSSKARYIHYLSNLGTVLVPSYIFLAFNAYPLITVLYGKQWLSAVPIASLVAIEYLILAPASLAEKLLYANGRARTVFNIKAAQFVARISALLVCVQFGLVVTAAGLVVAALVYTMVVYGVVRTMLKATWGEILKGSRYPAVAGLGAVAAGFAMLVLFGGMESESPLLQVFGSGLLNLFVWLLLAQLFGFPALGLLAERTKRVKEELARTIGYPL